MLKLFFKKAVRSIMRIPKSIYWKHLQKSLPNKPFQITIDKKYNVRIYPHDVIGRNLFVDGCFEPEEWYFVKSYIKPGMTVIDIGANMGLYSVLCADKVGDNGKVYCFEPNDRMFSELMYNLKINNLLNRCSTNNVAVSDSNGVAEFTKYKPGYEVYGSLGNHNREAENIIGTETVNMICLDDFLEDQSVDRIDFIKIDVEGAELYALKGAKNLLKKKNAPVILVEMADINTKGLGYLAMEIWEFLSGFGYEFYSITGQKAAKPSDFSTAVNLVAKKQ